MGENKNLKGNLTLCPFGKLIVVNPSQVSVSSQKGIFDQIYRSMCFVL